MTQSVISSAAFEAFFNASPAPCAIVDGATRFLHANNAWSSVLGYAADELQSMQLMDLLHDDDLDVIYHLFKPTVCDGERPCRFRHRDGSWRWLVCSTSPMPAVDEAFCLHMSDVGQLVDAQDELYRRDALLQQMETLANIGGWEGTLESDQITWTDNLFQLYELPIGPAPYHDYTLRSFDFEDGQRLSAAIGECHMHGTPWNLRLHMTTAKGNRKWVRSAGNLSVRDGKPYSIYGVLQDISEQVELEHELRRYTQTLSGLQSIATDQCLPFREKLQALLVLGCETLQLTFGLINRVDEGICDFIAAHSSLREVDHVESIPLQGSFTEVVLMQNDIVACHDVVNSPLVSLPSFRNFGFVTYIGIPIRIDVSVFGTLIFASNDKSREKFSDHELQLVELIARSAGYEIAREKHLATS